MMPGGDISPPVSPRRSRSPSPIDRDRRAVHGGGAESTDPLKQPNPFQDEAGISGQPHHLFHFFTFFHYFQFFL